VVFYNTMAQYLRSISSRYLRPTAVLCALICGLCLTQLSFSLTRAEMYQVTVPVADRSEAAQAAAFQAAMRAVLVRVTGRRSVDDEPGFQPLLANARRYVQQYRAAGEGQLWVALDGPAIERWLTQNGQPLWGHERPTTLVLLAVQSGGAGSVITTEDSSELKTAIDAAAAARGLPLVWPSASELQKYHVDFAAVYQGAPATLADMGRRLGTDGLLIGRANGPGVNATVRWLHVFQSNSSESSGALEGVNRAADLYAGLFAASGSLVPVSIEVVGVTDLREYASLETYLESLTFISHVSVESLGGGTIRFRLATRGGIEPLQRALSLNGRLQPIAAGENGIQRFQLHR
jgi:uncharacterized protein